MSRLNTPSSKTPPSSRPAASSTPHSVRRARIEDEANRIDPRDMPTPSEVSMGRATFFHSPSRPSEFLLAASNLQQQAPGTPSERFLGSSSYQPFSISPKVDKKAELLAIKRQIDLLQARAATLEADLASDAPSSPNPFGIAASPQESAIRALLEAPLVAGPAPTPSELALWRGTGVSSLLRLF